MDSKFSEIFKILDNSVEKAKYNIKDYNLRISSLEEVFNRIGEQEKNEEEANEKEDEVIDHSSIEATKQVNPISFF